MGAQRKYPVPEPQDRLLELLRTVGDEMYALAAGIVELGDALSEAPSNTPAHLQAFDLLGQRAFAHAKLVLEVAHLLGDGANWEKRLCDTIGAVPFEPDRRRLFAALAQDDVVDAPEAASGDMDWF